MDSTTTNCKYIDTAQSYCVTLQLLRNLLLKCIIFGYIT